MVRSHLVHLLPHRYGTVAVVLISVSVIRFYRSGLLAHRPPLYLEVHELHLIKRWITVSLRASSPIWASETSLASLSSAPCSRVLARLTSLAQIGELARRLENGVNRSLNKTLSGGIAQLISQILIRGTVHGPIQRRLKKKN